MLEDGTCKLKVGNSCDDSIDCVRGATCSHSETPFPTCNCDIYNFPTNNGTCEQKKNIGFSCASGVECLDKIQTISGDKIPSTIVCINEKCVCHIYLSREIPAPSTFLMHNISHFCAKLLTQNCDYDHECVTGNGCTGGVCVCDGNHYRSSDNSFCKLKKTNGEICDDSDQCMDILQCNTLSSKTPSAPVPKGSPLTTILEIA